MFFGLFFSFMFLAIAALLCLLWLGSLIFFIVGCRQRARTKMWVSGILFVSISIFGGMNYFAFHARPDPAQIYQSAFGSQPPGDVTSLRSDTSYGSDTRIFLAFKASQATIKRIKSDGWKWRDAENWAEYGGANNYGEPKPDWWNPRLSARTQVYERMNRTGDFMMEDERLIYNVGTRQAYYSYHSAE